MDTVFAIGILLFALNFTAACIVGMRKRPLYPEVSRDEIRFNDNFASCETSRNCLRVTVTRDEIWTRLWVPDPYGFFGTDNRIPRSRLFSVESFERRLWGKGVRLRWGGERGMNRSMHLFVRFPDRLLDALHDLQQAE